MRPIANASLSVRVYLHWNNSRTELTEDCNIEIKKYLSDNFMPIHNSDDICIIGQDHKGEYITLQRER